MKKTKILIISDHAMTTSGVAIQSKYLIEGLIRTGKYEVLQLGAAMYHEDMIPQKINDDFLIIPSNNFGDKDIIRSLLVSEKPDALIMFTDARFFKHIFDMEDEIHEVCPILWWHVWDNMPIPYYNKHQYESVDAINCISTLTYELCKKVSETKTRYIPHSLDKKLFYNYNKEKIMNLKSKILKEKNTWFIGVWVNRNIRRKRPADVLKSWSVFLEKQEKEKGHKNSLLIMHTDPKDPAGTDLIAVAKMLNIEENVRFSSNILNDSDLNMLYNIADFTLNISFSEGFGLSTLESLYTKTPIIANMTGGLIDQVFDKETGNIFGEKIMPKMTTISGIQDTPYLNEDYALIEDISDAIFNFYVKPQSVKDEIGYLGQEYVFKNFSMDKMILDWDLSIQDTLKKWKKDLNRIRMEVI
jgi:glycosyltransferase involved in cell wall biosynthesis